MCSVAVIFGSAMKVSTRKISTAKQVLKFREVNRKNVF